MSKTIDERVVEMRFDNKQFESNVATSMSTLDKLKQKLNLSGASKGLEDLGAAAKKVDMSGLGSAVESVQAKFSALDVVAVTALANITNSAVNAGKNLIKSLSVDQITAGWQKFSDKTTSVATLVAQGNAIEDVNKQLDRLNTFTDETSYNFTDMVSNIAKFTATGKGLEESVTAMEGIANWAALSGQNAATASRAMYQLAQAMGAGILRLEDYKSIQNASMDTEEFRQKCIDAAVELGTLKKVGEDTYSSLVATGKAGAESFNISQFTTKLTDGAWLTSEVMMKVFNGYSAAVTEICDAAEEKGTTVSRVIDEIHTTATKKGISVDEAIKSLGYSFDSFALKAFEAAQKARTFQDAIDSVKDAVSTGWMNTFELVFGDAEGATKLWTDVANQLYEVFAAGGERRNSILDTVMVSGWEKLIDRVKDAGIEVNTFESKVKECAKAGGVDVDGLVKKYGSLSEAFKNGAIDTEYLKTAFDSLKTGAGKTSEIIQKLSVDLDTILGKNGKSKLGLWDNDHESVKKLQTALEELGFTLDKFGVDGLFGPETQGRLKEFQKSVGLEETGIVDQKTIDALKKAGQVVKEVGDNAEDSEASVDDLLEIINRPSGRELIFDIIHNSLESIVSILDTFRSAWDAIFSEDRIASGLYNALSGLRNFTQGIKDFLTNEDNVEKLTNSFKGLAAIADVIISIAGGGVKLVIKSLSTILKAFNFDILDTTSNIGELLVSFRDWVLGGDRIGKTIDWIVKQLSIGIDILKGWGKELLDSFKNTKIYETVADAVTRLSLAFGLLKEGKISFTGFISEFGTLCSNIINSVPLFNKWETAFSNWLKSFKETETFQKLSDAVTRLSLAFGLLKEGKLTLWDFGVELKTFFSSVIDAIPIFKKWSDMIKDWIDSFKNLPAVKQLVDAVNAITDAFSKLFNNEIDAGEFGTILGENLAKALTALPNIIKEAAGGVVSAAIQVGKDFIAGFQNGIGAGITNIISSIVDFCSNFISAFSNALGVHSPSVLAYAIGAFFIAGFVNGLLDSKGSVFEAIKQLGEDIVKIFKSFLDYLTDESGKIEWDKIIAGGITIESLIILNKFANSFSKVADALTSFSKIFDGVTTVLNKFGGVLDKFGEVLNGVAWDFKAKAIMKMAISIGILVASIWVLTQIDDIGKLWNAVGVITVLAGILVALAWAMSKFSDASIEVNKSGASVKGLQSALLQIGIALLLVAATAKIIGNMKPDELAQGFKGLAAIAVGLIAFLAIIGGISNYSKDVSGLSGMMKNLSVAMLLMAISVKLIGMLSAEEIGKGIVFCGAFTIFIMALTAVAKSAGNNVSKVGGMAIKLAIAIGLLVIVCKLVNKLSAEEMLKGAAFAAAFVLFVGALVKVTKIGKKQKLAEVSGLVLSVSVSLLLMVGVCKLINKLSAGEMIKGGIAILAFIGMLKLMIKAVTIGNEQQIAKVSATILAMSTALLIMAGAAVILGMIDLADLAKGIIAVAILGTIVALMAHSLKGANDVKGSLIVIAIMIGILAASIVALSFIDAESLAASAAAMSAVMLSLSAMIRSLSGLQKGSIGAIATLIVLAGITALLAAIVAELSNKIKDPTSAIAAAGSLSVLMLAMSAVLAILNKINVNIGDATRGIIALTAMAIPLLAFVGVLALMSGVDNAMRNVLALTVLAGAMTLLLVPLTLLGKMATSGLGTSMAVGIVALTAMVVPMLAFVWALKQMDGIEDAKDKIMALVTMMSTMTLLLGVLTAVGLGGPAAIIGIGSLVALFAAIGGLAVAIGALMEKFPSIQRFLDTGLPVLEQLSESIGTMVGKFIGGIGEGISNSLVKMGDDISTFMSKLSEASDNASGIKAESFDGVKALMGVLLEIGGTSVATTVTDTITGIFNFGDNSMEKFKKDGVAFFNAMKDIGEASAGVSVNEESMNSVISVAQKLAELQSSIEPIGGVISWFAGRDDLATFGANAAKFMGSMKLAFSVLDGVEFNTEGMNSVISAATSLSTLQSSLEPIGGVISWFTGRDDLGKFGANAASFIYSMKLAFSSLDGVELNTEAMNSIISAATKLATLQSSLEPIGGVIAWFTGRDDLATFGTSLASFISSMKTALTTLEGVTLDEAALSSVISAATKLAAFQSSLEPMGGVVSWFVGRSDLGTFGTNLGLFADAMGKLKSGMGENGISADVVASITNSGNALIALQKALPEEHWFDGKMNLSDFSKRINDFADAMSTFGAKAAEIDSASVSTTINTAYRIKSLINSLKDIDTSGLATFTGVGTGGFGADGAAYKIAQAIAAFSNKVSGIDTEAVSTSVWAAQKLKTLINSLSTLNISGIENFKPVEIGKSIKSYADKVVGIDVTTVTASITAANRLKTFISGLSGLDTSGISKFKVDSVGTAISNYSKSVGNFNAGAVNSSINSGNKIKTFISSLAGLDTGGVASFKKAINDLSTVNIGQLVKAFSGASSKLSNAGVEMINGLVNGMQSKSTAVTSAANKIAASAQKAVVSKASMFATAGGTLATRLASGFSNKTGSIASAISSCLSSATSSIRSYYWSFYDAGSYLVAGFASGISASTWMATARAVAMAQAAISAARSVLRINSPSKVFKAIGSGVPEGFALGIGMLGNEVRQSVNDMASTAITTTRHAMTNVLDALSMDMDTQPTIRPVVDLSDVQTGASAIDGMFNGVQTLGVRSNLNAINSVMNAKLQNGTNDDIISAINKLGNGLENNRGDTYNFGDFTYGDESGISDAVQTLVRAAKMGRRV